jgi:adenylosuccinate lyase
MDLLFADKGRFQRWLEIEASLARAQAKVGLIPQEVADQISSKADVELLDLGQYQEMYRQTQHPLVAMLRLFHPVIGPAGQYIHIGPTTHDIVDTGTMLGLKQAYEIIRRSLLRIEDDLLKLADRHADTIMAGRTHNIQAVPITFGFKVAIWARELRRNLQRLEESRKRVLTIQLSGAGGIMAAFGPRGPEIQALVAKDLGLEVPEIAWHSARDRQIEFANLLVLIALNLGRIGQEVYLLMQTEVGELSEPWRPGIVGSSCMPHKINPVVAQHMISVARNVRYNVSLLAEAAMIDHEWNLEHFLSGREKLEETCQLIGELLTYGEEMAAGMIVYPERMRSNLEILKGLMQSESVMIELGKKVGKMSAHTIVNEDAVRVIKEGVDFRQVLKEDDRVNTHLTAEQIERLLDPAAHVGFAPQMTRAAVALSRKERETADSPST